MARGELTPVPVPLGSCYCPGSPHAEGDVVYLHPELSMAGGLAAQAIAQATGNDIVAIQERLADLWIRHGVADWNLVDGDGDPLPLTPDSIASALPYGKGGRLVAERADELYAEDILGPLVERLEAISRPGRSEPSTSPTQTSTRRRRKPSSTATTGRAQVGG